VSCLRECTWTRDSSDAYRLLIDLLLLSYCRSWTNLAAEPGIVLDVAYVDIITRVYGGCTEICTKQVGTHITLLQPWWLKGTTNRP